MSEYEEVNADHAGWCRWCCRTSSRSSTATRSSSASPSATRRRNAGRPAAWPAPGTTAPDPGRRAAADQLQQQSGQQRRGCAGDERARDPPPHSLALAPARFDPAPAAAAARRRSAAAAAARAASRSAHFARSINLLTLSQPSSCSRLSPVSTFAYLGVRAEFSEPPRALGPRPGVVFCHRRRKNPDNRTGIPTVIHMRIAVAVLLAGLGLSDAQVPHRPNRSRSTSSRPPSSRRSARRRGAWRACCRATCATESRAPRARAFPRTTTTGTARSSRPRTASTTCS